MLPGIGVKLVILCIAERAAVLCSFRNVFGQELGQASQHSDNLITHRAEAELQAPFGGSWWQQR